MRLYTAVAICLLAAPFAAHAETFTFTNGHLTITFDADPTPSFYDAAKGAFTVEPVELTANDDAGNTDNTFTKSVSFYTASVGGGFSIQDTGQGDLFSNGTGALFVMTGPQLFAGDVSSPQFLDGTFEVVNHTDFSGPQTFLVTIGPDAVTPEPSSFALLGTGLLGAVGILRKRFSQNQDNGTPLRPLLHG